MNTDSHFWIGNDHKICDDYACHSAENEPVPYVIVSDGCSESKNSDFGARILTRAAIETLPWFDTKDFGTMTIELAQKHQQALGLDSDALFATLLAASIVDNMVKVKVYGDGFVAFKTDHQITLYEISYPSGAPFYLNYQLYPDHKSYYIESTGLERIVTKYEIDIDSGYIILEEETIDGSEEPFVMERAIDSCSVVAVMSDGIGTFSALEQTATSKRYVPVDIEDVVLDLLSFKNHRGEFVHRRVQRFLETCNKNQMYHDDDISIGAIYLRS